MSKLIESHIDLRKRVKLLEQNNKDLIDFNSNKIYNISPFNFQ